MTFFKVKGIYGISRDDFPGYMQRFEKVAWIYGGEIQVEPGGGGARL